ncbi:hypothetical protein TRIUR3_34847 [Triticum urartu]|uniref:Uncharacterized protein n=1 Tax=Triticum urartu TaxID=4572 RepID=M7Z7A0_TRIUA|nr:hypothetical protein TRIUR3_34847 [Triticum urartu]
MAFDVVTRRGGTAQDGASEGHGVDVDLGARPGTLQAARGRLVADQQWKRVDPAERAKISLARRLALRNLHHCLIFDLVTADLRRLGLRLLNEQAARGSGGPSTRGGLAYWCPTTSDARKQRPGSEWRLEATAKTAAVLDRLEA